MIIWNVQYIFHLVIMDVRESLSHWEAATTLFINSIAINFNLCDQLDQFETKSSEYQILFHRTTFGSEFPSRHLLFVYLNAKLFVQWPDCDPSVDANLLNYHKFDIPVRAHETCEIMCYFYFILYVPLL